MNYITQHLLHSSQHDGDDADRSKIWWKNLQVLRMCVLIYLCRHTHCVCCRHLLLNLRNICVQETVLSLEQLLMLPCGVSMSSSSSCLPGLLAIHHTWDFAHINPPPPLNWSLMTYVSFCSYIPPPPLNWSLMLYVSFRSYIPHPYPHPL